MISLKGGKAPLNLGFKMRLIILSFIGLFSVVALAVTAVNQIQHSPSLTPVEVLDKNKDRKGLIISNKDTDVILVKFGSAQEWTEGLMLGSGSTFEFQHVPADSLYMRLNASTGSNHDRTVNILEFE